MQDSPPKLSDYRDASGRQARRKLLHKPGHLFRDRYRIVKVLASGGFGVTYLAQDGVIPGSPLCVIKQLCPKVNSPLALERAKRRFRKEAKVLAKVGSHSQIPLLLDYFTINDGFYLVQEYIPGQVLTKEVRRYGPQSERHVKQFLREILPVVKFVHRCRIIHRDIKPPNIIRCADDGRLVLIDFGAVRECLGELGEGSYQNSMTQFVGTPGFAPPEQQALRPTYSSDIYALGMTCLFLLTSKTPIEFDSDPKTGRILWQHLVKLSNRFTDILEKMLSPDVVDRFETVDELMRALVLEDYFDTLQPGLSYQPRSMQPDDVMEPIDGYLTPIQRQAISIRRWRSRRQKSNAQPTPNTGFPMSTGTASPNHLF
ncbi:serine/threonine-protein kinase [Oscillatoria sp. CS-180]|uniref:serine/threonine-protein kinase n=1 Tax=Oscillatoria sp. CS-180 TaxID=3021720 RepID=UPI00232CF2E6|nr:serine/threonine-protein kinase [Oscillatoria sp. CS-180]MDB9524427.1 serine/threonine-protein kinase [Oscillatoria sp. CS-180]